MHLLHRLHRVFLTTWESGVSGYDRGCERYSDCHVSRPPYDLVGDGTSGVIADRSFTDMSFQTIDFCCVETQIGTPDNKLDCEIVEVESLGVVVPRVKIPRL